MTEDELEEVEMFLKPSFKGLSKEYMIKCIQDEEIQKSWNPQTGDIIVTKSGNIYVISNTQNLSDTLGGTKYFYGGQSCGRDGSIVMNSTMCYTANESGDYYEFIDKITENPYHSSIRKFYYVPYPHEISKYEKDINKPSDRYEFGKFYNGLYTEESNIQIRILEKYNDSCKFEVYENFVSTNVTHISRYSDLELTEVK